MNECGNECYVIGGPWITSNPECRVHNGEIHSEGLNEGYEVALGYSVKSDNPYNTDAERQAWDAGFAEGLDSAECF